jgi:cobalamin biosynthesis protein CobW
MKIPATVITGFLGSGKTTLIRHLIAHAGGTRLALIINEFGDVGVDRELLLGCGIEACEDGDIVELANGCLCCTVADEFLPTMEALLDRAQPPDHILIETSGLALPKPLVKAFQWPGIRARVTVDGVVAVIDAAAAAEGRFVCDVGALQAARLADPTLDHETPLQELFEDQLACADLVVLNKTDLLDEAALGRVRNGLSGSVRAATPIVGIRFGALEPAVALGLNAAAEAGIDARPSHHDHEQDHGHEEFTSLIVEPAPLADLQAHAHVLRAAMARHDILRVKGFLDIPGKPMRAVVQGVGPRLEIYFDRPWRQGEARRSRLVVIGEAAMDARAVRAGLGCATAATDLAEA